MSGKKLRLSQILDKKGGKTCIIPIDHGTTLGPISGIENSFKAIDSFIKGGVSAVVLHKGILKMVGNYPELHKGNYLMHLSVSTCLGNYQPCKVKVGTVEEAIKLGAIGISSHTNLGGEYEREMIKDLANIAEDCFKWDMPLLSMIYVENEKEDPKKIAHAARLAQELGADIVKVDYPGTVEGFEEVINGVQIPVLIAGGSKCNSVETYLKLVNDALKAGGAGVSVGRNIFQHEKPELLTRLTSNLIEGIWTLEECFEHLNKELVGV